MRPRTWESDSTLCNCFVAINNGHVKHIWNPTEEEILPLLGQKYDLYYAMASFGTSTRKADQAVSCNAFWLDVDFKDFEGPSDAAKALQNFTMQAGLPGANWVIHSGNGLHVYWVLDQPILKEQWVATATGLKQLCVKHGFKADPARTADIASILRVPGTFNYKDPSHPKKVQVLSRKDALPTEQFLQAVPSVEPPPAPTIQATDEWGAFPAACADTIAARCKQMKDVKAVQGAVEEPLWRAALSILIRCQGGDKLIHEWSKGDPRYNRAETIRKAKGTAGPFTCQSFKELRPEGCLGCTFTVTSPILLSVAAEAPAEAPPDILTQVGRFKITAAGVWHEPPEDKATKVTDVKLWVGEVREKAREDGQPNRASLLIQWVDLVGKPHGAALYSADLYDTKAFVAWLANENIRPVVREVKELVTYISQYTKELLKKGTVRTYHERLGWYKDSFVLGKVAVTPTALEKALVQSSSPIAKIGEPSKDRDAWVQAVSLLDQPRLRKQAFAIAAGFGSPLLALMDWHSAVVSLAGPSGVGKSLAANLALSIYGRPEHLSQASSATSNSIEAQLTRQKNVPYLLDEVTNLPSNRLANFIYSAANGQGKAALTQSREFREVGTWALVPFITSNHPLLDMPNKEIEEAHRRRLLEFYISPEESLTSEEGAVLAKAMMNYGGAVAEPYLRFILKNKPTVIEMLHTAYHRFRAQLDSAAADRFALWTLAAAYVGGSVAKALGLFPVDMEATLKVALDTQREGAATIESPYEICRQALADFLNEHKPFTIYWKDRARFAEDAPQGRQVIVRVHGHGVVSIHAKYLKDYLQSQKIPIKAFKKAMEHAVTGETWSASQPDFDGHLTKVICLSPGMPQVRCHQFDLSLLGLTEVIEAQDTAPTVTTEARLQ